MDFDQNSVVTRMISDLKTLSGNTDIVFFSVNQYLLSTVAEGIAQLASYDEYILRESKWNIALNLLSLMTEAKFRGYKPKRKQSATGELLFSTSQDFVTKDFWNNDQPYAIGDRVIYNAAVVGTTPIYQMWEMNQHPQLTNSEPSVTADWTRIYAKYQPSGIPKTIAVPKWTKFSGGSANIVAVEDSVLPGSAEYINIVVAEGTPVSQSYTATGAAFEEFKLSEASVENNYYDVYVNDVKWTAVANIYSAYPTDQYYQIDTINDFSGVTLKFGNGVFGQILGVNDNVVFKYLKSSGSTGDVLQTRVVTSVTSTIQDEDGITVPCYSTNLEAITGGIEQDSIDTLRENAIISFQTQDRAVTYGDYKSILEAHPAIYKAIIWGAYEYLQDNHLDLDTYIPFEENVIHVSAYSPSGDPLTSVTEALLIEYLQDKKSPTDIVQFSPAVFVGMAFTMSLFINDRALPLATAKSTITSAIQTRYSYLNMAFKEALYSTVWKSFLHSSLSSLAYHESYIELVEYFTFTSQWTAPINLTMYPIKKDSVQVYIRDTTVTNCPWTLVGTDIAYADPAVDGIYIAYSNHSTTDPSSLATGFTISPLSAINYQTGYSTMIVTGGIPPTGWTSNIANYEIKVYYSLESGDLVPVLRNQLLHYEEIRSISATYV